MHYHCMVSFLLLKSKMKEAKFSQNRKMQICHRMGELNCILSSIQKATRHPIISIGNYNVILLI
jgi:hypothetical protein